MSSTAESKSGGEQTTGEAFIAFVNGHTEPVGEGRPDVIRKGEYGVRVPGQWVPFNTVEFEVNGWSGEGADTDQQELGYTIKLRQNFHDVRTVSYDPSDAGFMTAVGDSELDIPPTAEAEASELLRQLTWAEEQGLLTPRV